MKTEDWVVHEKFGLGKVIGTTATSEVDGALTSHPRPLNHFVHSERVRFGGRGFIERETHGTKHGLGLETASNCRHFSELLTSGSKLLIKRPTVCQNRILWRFEHGI